MALPACATEPGLQLAAPPALGWAVAVMAWAYWRGALHWAVVPVLLPAQLQSNAAAVVATLLAVPALHRLVLGAVSTVTALALPQTPWMGSGGGGAVTVIATVAAAEVPLALVAV